MADIRQRSARTTERFMSRTKERNRREYHLKRLDNVGDLSAVEDRSRLAKRMGDRGMSVDEAIGAFAKQEDASPERPVSEFFLERINSAQIVIDARHGQNQFPYYRTLADLTETATEKPARRGWNSTTSSHGCRTFPSSGLPTTRQPTCRGWVDTSRA